MALRAATSLPRPANGHLRVRGKGLTYPHGRGPPEPFPVASAAPGPTVIFWFEIFGDLEGRGGEIYVLRGKEY